MRASLEIRNDDDSTASMVVTPVNLDLEALRAPAARPIDRIRGLLVVAVCLGFHAAFLLALDPAVQATHVEEAIPVEIIVEPPPDQPQPATEPTVDPPAQTVEEPPAQDFARTAEQDREDGVGSKQPSGPAAKPPDPAQDEAPPQELRAAAAPVSQPDAVDAVQVERSTPDPVQPSREATRPPAFTKFTPLPEFQFAEAPAKRLDAPSGTAQPGYLSRVYGKIMGKMPRMAKPARPARGRVTFGVASNGSVFSETVAIPSGEPFLDAAALNAVRKAAPLPPPPRGGPVYLRFDYGSD